MRSIQFQRQGQVWMETLLYAAVSIAIIGAVLAFALPKLQQQRERALIGEHLTTLKSLDALVLDLSVAPAGTKRSHSIEIKQGALAIDSINDRIVLTIPDVTVAYTEPGITVPNGPVHVLTTRDTTTMVTLTLDYRPQGLDIALEKGSTLELTQAPTPYKLMITRRQLLDANGKPFFILEFTQGGP